MNDELDPRGGQPVEVDPHADPVDVGEPDENDRDPSYLIAPVEKGEDDVDLAGEKERVDGDPEEERL